VLTFAAWGKIYELQWGKKGGGESPFMFKGVLYQQTRGKAGEEVRAPKEGKRNFKTSDILIRLGGVFSLKGGTGMGGCFL